MSTALTALRRRLGRELLGDEVVFIDTADFTSTAAGSITSTNMLRNSLWGPTYFSDKNYVIFRPGAATSADYIRYAGDLAMTTGVLSHTGANYADTTVGSEGVELWPYGIRPTRELVESLQRCLEYEFVSQTLSLSHLSWRDGDMALITDTDWTDVGTPTTSAKATTAFRTPYGPRSYHLVADAVTEGTRSNSVTVGHSRKVSMFTICAADSGTISFQPYDVTNSAVFGTAVTTTEQRAELMVQQYVDVPATCENVQGYVVSTTNPGDFYLNQMWIYNHDDLVVRLPLSVTEGFMAPKIWMGVPKMPTGTGLYDAGNFDPIPLTEGIDYWLVIEHASAEPYKVRFRDQSLYQWPLFVETRRPASDLTAFAEDETATTTVPVHTLLPRWKLDVLDTILLNKIPPAQFKLLHDRATSELTRSHKARPIESTAPARPYWSPRLSAS